MMISDMRPQRRSVFSVFILCALFTILAGCEEEAASSDLSRARVQATSGAMSSDGPAGDEVSSGAESGADIQIGDAGEDQRTDRPSIGLGAVTFVPVYEPESAWASNSAARQMVDEVFADFASMMRTSGDWDATIEVYLTDDNPGYANTAFEETFSEAEVEGQRVLVVPAWQMIVKGAPDLNGPARPDGSGAEFIINFNVAGNADNAGLLRHEMMHGLGAVNALANFTATLDGSPVGPTPGDRIQASLYDLSLIDLSGQPLLGAYDATNHTFEVQAYTIEPTLMEWMDGDGGVFFRGIADDGGPLDMACGTFPIGEDEGAIVLNEPLDVMSAGVHPSWHQLAEPDRAFLRAMRYHVEIP